MGDGADWGPVIAGSAAMANTAVQYDVNQENRQFALDMYERQRSDALKDRDYANNYNSPEQVMQRYAAAGLNPNLIYGKNATPAESVRGSSVTPGNAVAPHIDVSGILNARMQHHDIQLKQAQTDNLHALSETEKTKQALNNTEIASIAANTAKTTQDYNLAKMLMDGTLQEQQNRLRMQEKGLTHQELQNIWQRNENALQFDKFDLEKIRTSNDRLRTIQEIAHQQYEDTKIPIEKARLAQDINILKSDAFRKEWQNSELDKTGVDPTNSFYNNLFNGMLKSYGNMQLFKPGQQFQYEKDFKKQ